MRGLLPHPGEAVDEVAFYPLPPGPHVRANMIASADGAASADGLSGGLGGPADRRLFGVLRSLTDVVLVGAGTARAERYGPVRAAPARRALRGRLGLPGLPPVAVLTGSLDLDPDLPLFAHGPGEVRPLLLTGDEAAAARGGRFAGMADVLPVGPGPVSAGRALDVLHGRGYAHVLCEGGPALLAQVVAAGRLDELCLTLAPLLVGPGPTRITSGAPLPAPVGLRLVAAAEEDGALFLRYARA